MTVWLERQDKMPLTLNEGMRLSAWKRRTELRNWRAWAVAEADGIVPMRTPVTVTATHLRRNRAAMPDCGSPILAVKAIIDGLVDAGVLPDDGPEYVRRLVFDAPAVVGFHGLRVVLLEDPS